MMSAAMAWVTWLLGDPTYDKIMAILAEIKADIVDIKGDIVGIKGDIVGIKGDIVGIKGDIAGLRQDMNRRFNNLAIALDTPPGAPAGIDEAVPIIHADDQGWVRGADDDLEDRLRRRRVNLPDTGPLPPVPLLDVD
jgi:hypothetical protein